jgi:hypothetical protein
MSHAGTSALSTTMHTAAPSVTGLTSAASPTWALHTGNSGEEGAGKLMNSCTQGQLMGMHLDVQDPTWSVA